MRYVTAGESHGRMLTAIVTGVPAGIPVDATSIDAELALRQHGYGRGGRQAIETDRVTILSGVRFGMSIGSPIALAVSNKDWDNWLDVMAVSGDKPEGIEETAPRPGHADLAGVLKTDSNDCRDVLERASARETAARVAAGGVAKALLAQLGVSVASYVESVGDVVASGIADAATVDVGNVARSALRCPDPDATEAMKVAIDKARADGESLGGVFVVVAQGVVPGVGGYAEADQRLDASIARGVMSIPAIKGVEIGDGFESARRPGSQVHDSLFHEEERGIFRESNHAGGVEGGMANGEPIVIRAAMKPIPTLMRPLASVDLNSHESVDASKERSDVCAVPAAALVAEAEVAFVLCRAYLDKFGRDCLGDILSALNAYRDRIAL